MSALSEARECVALAENLLHAGQARAARVQAYAGLAALDGDATTPARLLALRRLNLVVDETTLPEGSDPFAEVQP